MYIKNNGLKLPDASDLSQYDLFVTEVYIKIKAA